MRARQLSLVAVVSTLAFASCSARRDDVASPRGMPGEATARDAAVVAPSATAADATPATVDATPVASSEPSDGFVQSDKCPANMAFVSGQFCPEVERKCLHAERIKDERITICHEFEKGSTKCLAPRVPRAFCIDRYEYPNEPGAHPPWVVTWSDAQATCESKSKRLCYETEWTMACEGPDETPFPYGWVRDNTACNIDNNFIPVNVYKMASRNPKVRDPEVEKCDQSVPSGALSRCVSGYGVHDTTGNFDEWVNREGPAWREMGDTSKWAGLKGGAWGHVRNACRPMTTSHMPEWGYYFVSFRCCADAKGEPPLVLKDAMIPPHVEPADRAPIPHPLHSPGADPPDKKVPKDRGY
jgi:formylglycine-generating enzyme